MLQWFAFAETDTLRPGPCHVSYKFNPVYELQE